MTLKTIPCPNRDVLKCRRACCKTVRAPEQDGSTSYQQSLFFKEGPLKQLRNWRNQSSALPEISFQK